MNLDLMLLIGSALSDLLPAEDDYRKSYQVPEFLKKLVADGYTGRKGKGGFYRLNREGGQKLKEAIDLATGDYRPQETARIEELEQQQIDIERTAPRPGR